MPYNRPLQINFLILVEDTFACRWVGGPFPLFNMRLAAFQAFVYLIITIAVSLITFLA